MSRTVISGHPGKTLGRDDGGIKWCVSTPSVSRVHPWRASDVPAQLGLQCLWPEPTPGLGWIFFLDCFVFPSSLGLLPSPALPSSLFIPFQRT